MVWHASSPGVLLLLAAVASSDLLADDGLLISKRKDTRTITSFYDFLVILTTPPKPAISEILAELKFNITKFKNSEIHHVICSALYPNTNRTP